MSSAWNDTENPKHMTGEYPPAVYANEVQFVYQDETTYGNESKDAILTLRYEAPYSNAVSMTVGEFVLGESTCIDLFEQLCRYFDTTDFQPEPVQEEVGDE